MTRSLRVSLASLLIALSLLPALAIQGVLGAWIYQHEREHVLELERRATDQGADLLGIYLDGVAARLAALIQSPGLHDDAAAAREAILSDALFYGDTFDELAITDAAGKERSRVSRLGIAPPSELADHGGAAIFATPMASGRPHYQGFERSKLNGEPLLLVGVPTLSAVTGQPDGVLVARVRMRQIFARITCLPLGTTGALHVAGPDGLLLAHPELGNLPPAPPAPPADGVATGVAGGQVLQVRRPVSVGNLSIAIGAEMPIAEADANMQRSLLMTGAVMLAVGSVAALVCVIAVNRLSRPIIALATATRRLSSGATGGQVQVTRNDELGMLQRNFNQLVEDLGAQRATVATRTADLEASLARQGLLLETVAQLSLPLLPVWEGVVVLPIVGHVDGQRGASLTNALIEGVAQRRARVAIIDITGLAGIDDQVVTALLQAAQAVELLGARAMLAGISAEAARRIVSLSVNLRGLESYRDLQSAIAAAITRLEHPALA